MNKLSSNDIFEIKQSYKLAKDKDTQIDILSDLYLVDRQTIESIVHEEPCLVDDSNLICPIKDIFGPKGTIRPSKTLEVADWIKKVAPYHPAKAIASALGVKLNSVYRIAAQYDISWKAKHEVSDCTPIVDDDNMCKYPVKCHELSESKIGPGTLGDDVEEPYTEAICVDRSVPKALCVDAIRLCSKDTFTSADWFKLGTMLSKLESLL